MPDNLSNYLESALLNHSFGKTAFTMPATVAAALFTSTATAGELEAGTLTNQVANANAYARVAVPAGSITASTGGGALTTSADITFPTATGSWGTVRFVAFMDSTTYGTGNVLWFGQLTADKTIESGDVFKILAGQLSATLA